MYWKQIVDPFNNIALSAFVAVIPVLFIFWALIIKKMKGHKASLLSAIIVMFIAILIYGMPVRLALLSSLNGAFYGLFPIFWIVITAMFLFNITVHSGHFEIIKHFMASVTSDRRLQALLIAFSFGSFLEGTAGFGAPVAITAAMLVGIGFNPLYAAGICLIANTAPVAFGSIGIPITVAAQVSGLPEMALSQMVGRTLPFISLIIPLYLVSLMAGLKKAFEVWPAILVVGVSSALLQCLTANLIGPALPGIIAGVGSIVSLIVLLKFWKPKNIWRFADETVPSINTEVAYSNFQLIRAWSPFILLTIIIIAWGLQPMKEVLNSYGLIQFEIPGLHNLIYNTNGELLPKIFTLNYLSAAGTAILFSAIIAMPLLGVNYKAALKVFQATLNQLKFAIMTVAAIMGFAYVANDSGITLTMAEAFSKTGFLFPFFSPILGWLGVFITGSDTSANALFGKLQATTATSIGVDPVVTVAANTSGGVIAKMISPQSIAIGAAAGGLVGKESLLFRFTVKHSFILLTFICLLVFAQAYLISWLVPSYDQLKSGKDNLVPNLSEGYFYLSILFCIVIVFVGFILFRIQKNKTDKSY